MPTCKNLVSRSVYRTAIAPALTYAPSEPPRTCTTLKIAAESSAETISPRNVAIAARGATQPTGRVVCVVGSIKGMPSSIALSPMPCSSGIVSSIGGVALASEPAPIIDVAISATAEIIFR